MADFCFAGKCYYLSNKLSGASYLTWNCLERWWGIWPCDPPSNL